tara:strand:- start:2892 stop:3485 length:594 start_codon:yes stop_codon:yes gene_type:complete
MKFKIFKFEKVTSTNDVAIDMIKKEKRLSGYVYSSLQKKGRGRHGNQWVSQKGNLFGSLFFLLKKNYPSVKEFSIINLIIISEVIKKFCYGKKIKLKFPNDIYVSKKKICGILQEVITLQEMNFLIIGIGINVVTNPNINEKYQATNIFNESNKKPNIEEINQLIITSYEKFFNEINTYNYINFKKKAASMSENLIQ